MIPGLPLVKSLKSKVFPNLGFNSIPMYMSYKTEPRVNQPSPRIQLVQKGIIPLNFRSSSCVGLT
jgi:hypothetical protein